MPPTRRNFLTASIAIATGLAAGLALPLSAQGAWTEGDLVTLPPLTLLDGSPLDVAGLRGKVVVLEFWASWCPFCAKQNPWIEALYRETRGRGLEVVAVSIDKTKKAAEDYIRKNGYTFKVGMMNPAYEAIFRLRRGLPQVYIIGRDGRLEQKEMGEMFEDDVRGLGNRYL